MFRDELHRLFSRPRTWVLLSVLALIPVALAFILWAFGGPERGRGPAFFDQVAGNGVFAATTGLGVATGLLLPLVISVVAGDTVAGEASTGTLRYVLVVPVRRRRFICAKYGSAVVFCFAAAVVIAVAGLAAGALLFPMGPVTTLSGATLPLAQGMLRIIAAALVVGASMTGIAAIGLFVSTLTSTPVAAMAAPAIVAILAEVLGSVPQLRAIHPWLPTQYWFTFGDLLRVPVRWDGIVADVRLQLLYVAVFGAAALLRFRSKDILA